MFDYLEVISRELGDEKLETLTAQEIALLNRMYQAGYRAGHSAGVVAVNAGEMEDVK